MYMYFVLREPWLIDETIMEAHEAIPQESGRKTPPAKDAQRVM